MSTECDLSKAPRRQTDGAVVLDTEFYAYKLYNSSEGDAKLIARKNGAIERQYRVNLGKLPIGYRYTASQRTTVVLNFPAVN